MNESTIHKTKITTSLGTFEFEGSQEFVEKQIERIVGIAKSSPQPAATGAQNISPKEAAKESTAKQTLSRKASVEQPQMLPNLITDKAKIDDLRSFYAAKNPGNNIENYTVFALWLKNSSQLAEVSINEMWTLYKILGIKAPKALVQVFRDGKSKKAYFESGATPGKYYLTSFGETFVEHDLPHKASSK